MAKSAKLLYQGHASLRIDTAEGKTIYVDPFMGKGYDVPADLILETHGHHDHTCADLIEKKNSDCRIITWTEAIKDGRHQTFDLGFVKVEAVEAGYNKNHNCKDCVGFILSFSDGTTLYLSGDTSTTPQMKELAARHLDYAFFCCDGVYNMDIPEAMECARLVGAKHSVPYHMIAGKDFDLDRAESFDVPGRLIVKPGDVLELAGSVESDNRDLIGFWDRAIALTDEDKAGASEIGPDDWKEMAPSEKLFNAVSALGGKKKVLDYGCGNGWAAITAAKSGCPDVTAVDVSKGPAETTAFYAKCFGVDDKIKTMAVGTDWLGTVAGKTYDGLICSNVLDVVPSETADEIIREIARVSTDDASVIIGMNFYMTPAECAERGMELVDGCRFYADGVLRLVFKSDDEWQQIFSKYFTVERLEHFAWPGESKESRRLFFLRKGVKTVEKMTVNGKTYDVIKLLGHGKGGYSYLAESGGRRVVLKQIHHEPCDYYSFGNKIEAELNDYKRLKAAGVRIPEMIDVDVENERIIKEFVDGETIYDMVRRGESVEEYIEQAREMAAGAKASALNIDYFPTNFVVNNGRIWYIDYECNEYMDEWNFENWGIKYWSQTPEFLDYVREHAD